MGKPIISIPFDKIYIRNAEIFECLKKCISLNQENLNCRILSIRIYNRAVLQYETNKAPTIIPETKIFYSTGGSTRSQKEKAAIVLLHEIIHQYAGKDTKTPKIPWDRLSPEEKSFYIYAYNVIYKLDNTIASNIKELYPNVTDITKVSMLTSERSIISKK